MLTSNRILGAGKLCVHRRWEQRRKETGGNGHMFGGGWERSNDEVKMFQAFEKVAKEIGAKSISSGSGKLSHLSFCFLLLV
ncbi:uncharacterized protein C8R40DRAFT_861317 [Lentinula edodes]|uniref:uncharacterized protein n=1 Tax=Lentinula edodes TaxID=5353 RepID=UPI001E8CEE8A|nr:uncharacterized protein C8R40DRAFT_861317 [Lentinula edodes]KAH7868005.1 hypothetical protein C8R40DRAFT_861317 [Lentinula edodes]